MNSLLTTVLLADAVEKYSPDQPRDEKGRWTAGDTGNASVEGIRAAPKGFHDVLTRHGYQFHESHSGGAKGTMLYRYDRAEAGLPARMFPGDELRPRNLAHTIIITPDAKNKQVWEHITVHPAHPDRGGIGGTKSHTGPKGLEAHLKALPERHKDYGVSDNGRARGWFGAQRSR